MYVARGILMTTRLMGGRKAIDHPLIEYILNKVKMRQKEEVVEEGRAVDVTPPDEKTPTEKSLIEYIIVAGGDEGPSLRMFKVASKKLDIIKIKMRDDRIRHRHEDQEGGGGGDHTR